MQPMQDALTITRRSMDVEDYIDVIRRHKSWIVGPAFLTLVVAVVVAFLWPDSYISEASIQVVPPQVPEKYVPSNVNSEMTQRINQMANSIESRAKLTDIIHTYGLYRSQLSRQPLEDVIESMRRDIRISPVGSMQTATGRGPISAFKVSFEYSNRYLAQRVTAELARSFIDANIRALAQQSAATTDFLKEQWEAARKTLDELESQMTAFRLKNAGRLPDQLQANLQTLRSLETQLAGVNDVISRIGQEKLLLENQLRILRDQESLQNRGDTSISTRVKDERLVQTEREILSAEALLSGLRERYTSTHPDVRQVQAQIEVLKRRRDALAREEEKKPSETAAKRSAPMTESARELQAQITRIQALIRAKDMDLDERSKTQKNLSDAINSYNARIQASPLMEQQYAELSRDYSLAKARYEDLNAKKSLSETATALENRQYGERLELLESASLPETPAKPNRLLIVGSGAGVGLFLGLLIAGFREMKDTSLKNLKDARAYTSLPVLGTVPLLENDLVVRRKRRLAWLAWSTACIIGIVVMTSSIYYYYSTKV